MSREDLAGAVIERARESDGKRKLTCAEALELAKQFGAEAVEVGRICNQNNIKICKCRLGCFR